ncbi:50S ribosomal protein L21 [Jannaschia seosinensis]|uniref:Large ribosomal subunit protein bL21 n=1 Tax=Jannaschia seosinensis TaxID=313367 RepID=A0A0M7BFA7_9RHOB|nr:50S ribosomal protein L21 [Jannaschia seosinensis]CUH40472.1 50S ribosomal protein L21 [Jannaschia seosinensis]
MFAVLKTGGKQYRVAEGDVLRVEKLAAEAGEKVQFNEVLMIGGDEVTVGTPTIDGAAVQADVIDQIKGEKLIHYVKRRRKHSSQRTKGHRQQLTLLRVTDIMPSGGTSTGVKVAVGAAAVAAAVGAVAAGAAAVAGSRAKRDNDAASKPAKDAVSETASKEEKIEDAALAGTKPSNLLDSARNGQPDDLKKISGVGPKLEGLLHENGVFHFDQISEWGPEEVAYMDDRLSFKGRIERDGWIDQAKTFAAEQE